MEVWASRYGKQVQFLMVCVDAAGVAIQFGKMFGLKNAVNCWIPSRGYMPVGYGQLGCSGFIVSDGQGCFVSRKTKAYLQYGDNAFLHVEQLLHQNFAIQPWTEEERNAKTEDVLNPNWTLPSVGVSSMDHEHEECEEALSLLLRTQSAESLRKALEKLTEHFQHEENLMKSSGFGRPGESFSPYANHVKDHERILDIGYFELAKLTKAKEPQKSFLSTTCSDAKECGADA